MKAIQHFFRFTLPITVFVLLFGPPMMFAEVVTLRVIRWKTLPLVCIVISFWGVIAGLVYWLLT